jgi:hypothetical protein
MRKILLITPPLLTALLQSQEQAAVRLEKVSEKNAAPGPSTPALNVSGEGHTQPFGQCP